MKKVENIPEAASFMESSRAIGYSFSTAVADIIDNSIFAMAKNINLSYNAYCVNPYFIIEDDGYGMNSKELFDAMRYGTKNPSDLRDESDLGRFGLGLKTASLSQCRRLTVVSKKDNEISCMIWDLDEVIKMKNWTMIELDLDEIYELDYEEVESLKNKKSGTLVIWENLDRVGNKMPNFSSVYTRKIEKLEDHLALVFHRFLNGDARRIMIRLNGREIEKVDPFLKSNFATQVKPKQVFKINETPIIIQPFVLPFIKKMTNQEIAMLGGKESLKSSQGYYVYRNKRLIIWGKWFGQYPKHELQKLVRVQVDIPNSLDYIWDIDVKKSQAVLPNVIKKDLGIMINKALMEGKNIFKYRGRKTSKKIKMEYIWDRIDNRGSISYKVNTNHPIIKALHELVDNEKMLNVFLNCISENLPFMQIYNDMADSNDVSSKEIDLDNRLIALKQMFDFLPKDEVKQILTGDVKFEAIDLSIDEINKLKEVYKC